MPTYNIDAITPKIIAKTLTYFRETSLTVNLVHNNYKDDFGKKGKVITIPVPRTPTVKIMTPGRLNLTSGTPSDITYDELELRLKPPIGVEIELTDDQLDDFLSERMTIDQIQLGGIALAKKVDKELLVEMGQGINRLINVPIGAPVIPNDPKFGFTARKWLNRHDVPNMFRYGALRPDAAELFLTNEILRDASKSGRPDILRDAQLKNFAGFDWYETNHIYNHVAGNLAQTTLLTPAAGLALGATQMTAEGSGLGGDYLKGDHFTIAGINEMFVYTEDGTPATASTAVMKFAPGTPIALVGAAAITTIQKSGHRNPVFQKEVAAFATRPLRVPQGFTGGSLIQSYTDPVSGITMRLEITRLNSATQWTLQFLYALKIHRRIAGVSIMDAVI